MALIYKINDGLCIFFRCVKFIADVNVERCRIEMRVFVEFAKRLAVNADVFIRVSVFENTVSGIAAKRTGIIEAIAFL